MHTLSQTYSYFKDTAGPKQSLARERKSEQAYRKLLLNDESEVLADVLGRNEVPRASPCHKAFPLARLHQTQPLTISTTKDGIPPKPLRCLVPADLQETRRGSLYMASAASDMIIL